MTPFNFEIRTEIGELVLQVKRGVTIFDSSNIVVFDGDGKKIGVFKQKLFSFTGRFEVHDKNDSHLCTLQGKWSGWDFKFTRDNNELAIVSHDWASFEKELFTSADNYAIKISNVAQDDPLRQLIIAAVMCIDMVFKE